MLLCVKTVLFLHSLKNFFMHLWFYPCKLWLQKRDYYCVRTQMHFILLINIIISNFKNQRNLGTWHWSPITIWSKVCHYIFKPGNKLTFLKVWSRLFVSPFLICFCKKKTVRLIHLVLPINKTGNNSSIYIVRCIIMQRTTYKQDIKYVPNKQDRIPYCLALIERER